MNLYTKSKQLSALREVRESAYTEYKALEEEEYIRNKNICYSLKSMDRRSVSFTKGGLADSSEHAATSQWSQPPP